MSLVSLLNSHSTDDYYTTLSLTYDYSEEKLFLSVELNYEFDNLRYYYLDGTHRYTIFEGVGNCYAVNTSNLYGIDLKGFLIAMRGMVREYLELITITLLEVILLVIS